jgi:hypothetical protein
MIPCFTSFIETLRTSGDGGGWVAVAGQRRRVQGERETQAKEAAAISMKEERQSAAPGSGAERLRGQVRQGVPKISAS